MFAASLFTLQRFATTFSALKFAGIAWSAPIQMLLPVPITFRNVVAFVAFLLHHVCCYTYTQVASSYVHLPAHYSFIPPLNPQSFLIIDVIHDNWARSPRDCHQETVHQEEVTSQPAINSDSCKVFTDKCPRVDVFCNHVKARKKLQVQNESWMLRPVAQLTYSTAPNNLWTSSSYFDENLWHEM